MNIMKRKMPGGWLSSLLILVLMIGSAFSRISAQEAPAAPQKTFTSLIRHAAYLAGGAERYRPLNPSEIRIVRVTTLDRDGEGSLAWAVRQKGPRIVVFEVGGVIDLAGTTLKLQEPYLYIAGQTAPVPGITLIRGGVSIQGHDMLIRHLRVRPGDGGRAGETGWEIDGMTTWKSWNVVVDHCSLCWATDELLSASGPRHEGADRTSHDITFSNNIIAECLSHSTHSKGEHSKGTLIHDYCSRIAIVGNLYASNVERNPLFKPNVRAYVANNLIYNPGRRAIHAAWPENEYAACPDSLRPARIFVAGNVLIPGPDTPAGTRLIFGHMEACHRDNLVAANPRDTVGDRKKYIVDRQVGILQESPLPEPAYRLIPASETAGSVLACVGAFPANRDSIDDRIVRSVRQGTGRIIDSQDEVGGYPVGELVRQALELPDADVESWLDALAERR